MTDYFTYNANKSGRKAVSFDVVDFEPQPEPMGIEVQEMRFDSTGEFLAHVARETGRGP